MMIWCVLRIDCVSDAYNNNNLPPMKNFCFRLFLLTAILSFAACTQLSSNGEQEKKIDIQGHRGARGLLPENTLPAFLKAIDLGVNTLEMDVVITKDKKVLLSHEPFMSHEICLDTLGQEIPDSLAKSLNIYQMTAAEAQKYDCGSKYVERFPQQQKMKANKPLLSAVIEAVEAYTKGKILPPMYYNIETKSLPEGDEMYHPKPAEFVRLLLEVVNGKGIEDRTIVQSFDPRTLEETKQQQPKMTTALLVGNREGHEANVQKLSFVPEIYSCHYLLVTDSLMRYARDQNMKVIPWTVNDTLAMRRLDSLEVDGIITDYPDLAAKIFPPKSGKGSK